MTVEERARIRETARRMFTDDGEPVPPWLAGEVDADHPMSGAEAVAGLRECISPDSLDAILDNLESDR